MSSAMGAKEMSSITRTGCRLSGAMTAFLAANPGLYSGGCGNVAVAAMGLAGEIAMEYMTGKVMETPHIAIGSSTRSII